METRLNKFSRSKINASFSSTTTNGTKMSDKDGEEERRQSVEDERPETSEKEKTNLNLKNATHKLKAEALRRLQLSGEKKLDQEEKQVKSSANEPSRPATANAQNEFDRSRNLDSTKRREQAVDDPADLEEARAKELDQEEKHKVDDSEVKPSESSHELLNKINNVSKKELRGDLPESEIQVLTPKITTEGYISETVKKSDVRPTAGTYYIDKQPTLISDVQNISSQSQHDADDKTVDRQSWLSSTSNNLSVVTESIPTEEASRQLTDNTIEKKAVKTTISNSQSSKESIELAEPSIVPVTNDPNSTSSSSDKGVNDPVGESEDIGSKSNTSPSDHRESTKQVIWKSELAFATDESRKEPEIDGSYSTEKRNGIFGKSDGAIENKEVNQQLMSGKDQEVLIESDTSETEQLSSLTEDKAKKIVHSNDMSDPTHYNNPYPKHPEDDLKKNSAVLSDNTKEVKNDSKLDQNKENADYKANVTVSEGPNMKNGYESPSDTNENKGDATLNENEENMIETDNDAVTEIQESQKDKEQGRDTKMKSSLSTTTVKNSMEDQPSIADQRLPDQVSAIENDTSNVKENDKNPLDAGSVLGSSFSHDIGNSKTKLSTGDENQEGSFSNVPRELEDNVQGQNLTASEIKCEDVDGNTSGLALKVEESSLEPSAMSTDDKKADIGNVAPGNEINAREDKGPATSGEQQEVTSSLKGNGGNKDDNQGKDKEQLVTGEDGDSGMVAVEDKENPENEGDSLRKDDEVEEEERIPEDFYYEYDKYKSIPYATDEVPLDLLSLYHSFGYECTKRSNLHMLDEDHILFSAGNMVEILNIKSNEIKYLRTVGGGGIGAVAVHPDRTHFAVAEKGIKPDIIIYEYPSLRMYRILRNGTEEAYSNLDFSPTGEKLASVGSAPDFMLTVWDWRQEKVMLRTKAFSQDVYKVAFSPEDEGHLCTSGTGHIRFWSMASTFTGLKLQGEIGRFGTTELSDIAGFVELPDGKVLSGSEWGNMLLWEGGLIKVEISRKGKKTCHQGMIEQFFLDEGELITIGVDGYVKVWDFESIDTADAVDESKLFEMEPMSELKVGSDVKLMSMVKSVNPDQTSIWYAQDAAGGIWKLDLSFSHTSQAPKKLLSYHAGKINGIDVSPFTHIAATVGDDNTVRLFDYLGRKPLCYSRFTAPGTSILWVPKVVDPEALSILAGFADGVMRHLTVAKIDASTTAAKKALSDVELKLTQVFKPHTKCVTSIAISGDGKFLATGSEDCTVFFFSIGKKYDPIGFIETGATAVSLSWSSIKQGSNLLVCCKDGSVLEVACPDPGKNDTSKTFLIPLPGLKKKEFKFKSVKDDLIAAEEAERKAKEEEEKRRIEEEEKRRRRERGIIEEEDEDEEKEENKEEKEESEEETIQEKEVHVPGFIVRGFYRGEPGKFCLFLDGWDAGYLYECEFPELNENSSEEDICCEPVKSIKLNDIDDVSVKAFHFSKRGQYLVLGLENGALRIHLLETHEMKQLNSYWLLNVHDNQFGAILSLTMSHDDRFLLCVAADGNFFTFSFMDEGKLKAVMGEMKAKLAAKAESAKLKHVDDIEDPNFYSIELEKQKLEHDRMLKRAEEKKQQVRQTINLLRRDFKKIVSKSQELPSYLQLPQSEFVIDPEMRKDIERETEDKIELLKRELAWESEKHLIGLRKLQRRFKDMIECERIVVYSFNSPHKVASFLATQLPPEFQQILEENKRNMYRGGTIEPGGMLGTTWKKVSISSRTVRRISGDTPATGDVNQKQIAKKMHSQGLDAKIAKAIEKAEQRKKRRLARQAEWDELYRTKPDDQYADPNDVAAIKEAQENIGDFKLKTAKDYVVPESQRVNAEKKRVQLLQLQELVHQYKWQFNQRLLALRDKKIEVVSEVKKLCTELEQLQSRLPSSIHTTIPSAPVLDPEELPEKAYEYTKETLLAFKKDMDSKLTSDQKDGNGGAGGFGGFAGFGGGGESHQPATKPASQIASTKTGTEQRGRSTSVLSTLSSQPRSASSIPVDRGTPEIITEEQYLDEEPSDMEKKIQEENKIRLTYERDVLLKKIKELLSNFDAELRVLRHEKIHLEVDLKNADLRLITLFEELVLLKEFEKRENVLMGKVETKMQEKEDMQEKVEECQLKLEAKKEEIDKLQEKDKALYSTFSHTLGENNKFEGFLTKVFKKKIKRVKKTEKDAGSDEESEEDESDEDYDSDEEENSDAEELDDSVCPPGCDQAIFDQVCQLRENRLDLEEAAAEEKKAADALKKELDGLIKKVKIIDSALKTAEADLEAFQREKQQKLNELDVVVTLKLNQLQYVINSSIPQDLAQCLIFTSSGLEKLQRRIKELEKEKAEQKKLYRERRQQHVQLIRDKKVMDAKIIELEEKVKQTQLLKFGRLIDLEKLETVSVNRVAEELKEKLRLQEFESAKEIAEWEKKIDAYKAKLTQVTRENTQRLDTYTVLLQEKKELEHQLDSRQKNLGGEFQGNRKADFQERQRLIQLIQLQGQEIEALKEEITMLSRKGGHIIPPSQPPQTSGHSLGPSV